MRLHRFFVSETPKDFLPGNEYRIENVEIIHQWYRVFRMKKGDELVILDNSGFEYLSSIAELDEKTAIVRIIQKEKNEVVPKREVTLYQSIIKKDNFEWVVQKCTEIGVNKIVPLISARSEKKSINLERLKTIAKEASEQSGRGKLPELHELLKLPEALKSVDTNNTVVLDSSGIAFTEFAKRYPLDASGFTIFIGPEGGWSEEEIEKFKENNAKIISLGNSTLRAETAAIVGSALFTIV